MSGSLNIKHKVDRTASSVNTIQSAAKDFQGSCTQKFSQCTDPVSRIINMLPSTSQGICLMLAASWIGNLANGKSLWTNMYFGGKFNAAAIVTLMHNFIDDEVQNMNWADVRKKYFKQHNVTLVKPGTTFGNATAGSATIGPDMIKAINAGPGAFISIDLYGPGGAHSVAAWNAMGSYMFFDPNYGEFQFQSSVGLGGFLNVLIRLSTYTAMFGQVRSDIWRRG